MSRSTTPLYYSACTWRATPRRERLGRWRWEIRDGATGPILAAGTALTQRAAIRHRDRTADRCVRVTGVCRCDRPVLRPLDQMGAYELTRRFDRADIPVTVRVDGPPGEPGVVLWPALAITTEQEVAVLRAVLDETDAPVRWAGVVGA